MTPKISAASFARSRSAAIALAVCGFLLAISPAARPCGFEPDAPPNTFVLQPSPPDPCTADAGDASPADAGTSCAPKPDPLLAEWCDHLALRDPSDCYYFSATLYGETAASIDQRLADAGTSLNPATLAADRFARFLREVEPFANPTPEEWGQTTAPPNTAAILELEKTADAAIAKTSDTFFQQRYALQGLRLRFFRRAWSEAIAFYDSHRALLQAPSAQVRIRAGDYLAGALYRAAQKPAVDPARTADDLAHEQAEQSARALLEKARVIAADPSRVDNFILGSVEDAHWRRALELAADNADRIALWNMVGTRDAEVAMVEIQALDPASPLLAKFAGLEIADLEESGSGTPAKLKQTSALAQQTAAIAARGLAAPSWFFWMVSAHASALSGDLAATRAALAQAAALHPSNPQAAMQQHATLALALSTQTELTLPQREELAHELSALQRNDARQVANLARHRLALHSDPLDAELLESTTASSRSRGFSESGSPSKPDLARERWTQPAFIRDLGKRLASARTAFEQLEVSGWIDQHTANQDNPAKRKPLAIARAELDEDLVFALILNGEFHGAALAAKKLSPKPRAGGKIFGQCLLDSKDCDEAQTPDLRIDQIAARLEKLRPIALGTGDAAARASLTIGTTLYNLTRNGRSTELLPLQHNWTGDARPALAWYERAFAATSDRELQAKIAFFAAKVEIAHTVGEDYGLSGYDWWNKFPAAAVWYPREKAFSDTQYHREILAECGYYRHWYEAQPK